MDIKRFIKSASFSLGANIFSMFVGLFTTLVIPKFVGIEVYGYYQLYLLYITYCVILSLGWSEGIYLEIGGKKYADLNRTELHCQLAAYSAYIFVVFLVISIGATFLIEESDKRIVVLLSCAAAIIINVESFLTYIIQATDRMLEYSVLIVIWRGLGIAGSLAFVLSGRGSYQALILCDIVGRILGLIYLCYCCKDIIFGGSGLSLHMNLVSRFGHYLRSGHKLLFATMADSLITGIVRFCVEDNWDIFTFALLSLTFGICSMVSRCVNAVSVALFPSLRNASHEELSNLYQPMNRMLSLFLFSCMIFYYPTSKILTWWLPQYKSSFTYAPILFPVCVYECKSSLLVSTYLKTLRREDILLKVNVFAALICLVFSLVTVYWAQSMILCIVSMVIVFYIRSVLGEVTICRIIGQPYKKQIFVETIMVTAFILCNQFCGLAGCGIYLLLYLCYLYYNRTFFKQIILEFVYR